MFDISTSLQALTYSSDSFRLSEKSIKTPSGEKVCLYAEKFNWIRWMEIFIKNSIMNRPAWNFFLPIPDNDFTHRIRTELNLHQSSPFFSEPIFLHIKSSEWKIVIELRTIKLLFCVQSHV